MPILAHLNSLVVPIFKNISASNIKWFNLNLHQSSPQWPRVFRGQRESKYQAQILQCTRLCALSVYHSHLDLQVSNSVSKRQTITMRAFLEDFKKKQQNVVTFVVKWGCLATSVGPTDGGVGIAVGPRVEQCSWPRVSNQPKNRQSKMGHNP